MSGFCWRLQCSSRTPCDPSCWWDHSRFLRLRKVDNSIRSLVGQILHNACIDLSLVPWIAFFVTVVQSVLHGDLGLSEYQEPRSRCFAIWCHNHGYHSDKDLSRYLCHQFFLCETGRWSFHLLCPPFHSRCKLYQCWTKNCISSDPINLSKKRHFK